MIHGKFDSIEDYAAQLVKDQNAHMYLFMTDEVKYSHNLHYLQDCYKSARDAYKRAVKRCKHPDDAAELKIAYKSARKELRCAEKKRITFI